MRWLPLARRNFITTWRDWLSLGVNVGLPVLMLLVLQALSGVDDFFAVTSLTPGIVVFGFAMLTMTSAMALALDRETSMFARLLTTPLRAGDFVVAYSVPYLAVSALQAILVFALALLFGLEMAGNVALVILVLALMAVWYVAMAMFLGSVMPYKAVSAAWVFVLLLTIFGGTWVNLDDIGGVFRTVGDVFPFAHALDAVRAVMLDGAGLADIAGDLWWVIGHTVVLIGLAVGAFRWRMSE